MEKVYAIAPGSVRDVMTSMYGYFLYRQRYQGRFQHYMREIIEYLHMNIAELETLQRHRLRAVIRHATTNVPYYHHQFRRLGLSADHVQEVSDLVKIPILEKHVLRQEVASILASAGYTKRIKQYSSGSTGTPLALYTTPDALQFSHALEFFVRHVYGLSIKSRRASFIGRVIVPVHQTEPPFWHYNAPLRQYLFSTYHMNDRNLATYVNQLENFRPEEIVGYPSALAVLAHYLLRRGITTIRPSAVFGNSEPILLPQREALEEAFQCPVREWYSSTEQAFFAYQCPQMGYHIVLPYGIVEIVNPEGFPVRDGEVGDVVCTALTNYAMPLIRYRVGDRASKETITCSCGVTSPVFKSIEGRSDDMILTPDGRRIGRLDPVFKGLRAIRECQIVQEDIARIVVRVVKDPTYSKAEENDLVTALKKRLGSSVGIRIEYIETIPRGANGKFKAVVSCIKDVEGGKRPL